MYENLLPIGSIVALSKLNKRVMIVGRIQAREGDDRIFDYSGCYYPDGIISSRSMLFFDADDVEALFFVGYQDKEELDFRSKILANLDELQIVDGKIVPVE